MKVKPAAMTGGVIVELGAEETQLPHSSDEKKPQTLPVFQLKRILVPVDFTECTKEALFYGMPLARQFGAELLLLYVMEPPYSTASEAGVVPAAESPEDARRQLEGLRDKLPGDVRCEILLRRGGPQFEIIAVAKEQNSDLIILSTHGRTGLGRLLMGSVAEKVVRHAPCPVLIVRQHEHEFISSGDFNPSWSEETAQIEETMRSGL